MIAKKLHLKPGMRVAIANAPAGFSLKAPGVTVEKSLKRDLDLALLFATTQKDLKTQWPKLLASVKQEGAVWVAYPKKSSGIDTDLGMGEWEATKGMGRKERRRFFTRVGPTIERETAYCAGPRTHRAGARPP